MTIPELKYKSLIEAQKIGKCPSEECKQDIITGFRWVFSPITHDLNFLPNFIFNEKKGILPRINNNDIFICSCCGISFFDSEEVAKNSFKSLSKKIKEK